jgi:hypothetical protein
MEIGVFEEIEDGIYLYDIGRRFSGHGHWTIIVTLKFGDSYKDFSRTTNNMPGYDSAMDIDNYEDRALALFEIISHRIKEDVIDWISDEYFKTN